MTQSNKDYPKNSWVIQSPTNVIRDNSRLKYKKHIIISINAEKELGNIYTYPQSRNRGNIYHLIKDTCEKSYS